MGFVGVVGLWSVGKKEEIHVYMVVHVKKIKESFQDVCFKMRVHII